MVSWGRIGCIRVKVKSVRWAIIEQVRPSTAKVPPIQPAS